MIGTYLICALVIALLLLLNRNRVLNNILLCSFGVLQWALTIYAYKHQGFNNSVYFNFDSLGLIFLIVLSIICIPTFYHSHIYLIKKQDTPRQSSIYYSALTLLITALSAAYLANHMGVTWIFVELTTLSASALIYHRRNIQSLEGTWKYIFVCSISITLVFIGILFLSIALHEEGITDLFYKDLLIKASTLNIFWLKLAFLFIFTGYTAKAGLVPMYTAGIDAKDKAPSPAGALFSSVLMNVGFLGIFRFYEVISHTSLFNWANNVLLISGILSVFVATVYVLKVKNIKRMMAYSGVEHMGLVVIGLASGGIGRYAAILHLILHSFAKSALFFHIGQIYRTYKNKSIYYIGDYFKYNITGAMVLLFSYFTITAMPPSGMFVSEFLIFQSIFQSGKLWLLILVMLLLTLIIWSQGKNFFKMLFIKPVGFDETKVEKINPIESVSQFVLLALVVWLGLNPPTEMVDLINSSISNLPK